MPDIVDSETRSRMMAGIRGQNTKPELAIRKALHRRGLRYVLHSAAVPGKPDLAFPSRHAAVFIHGCFWHGHDCPLFKIPSTRSEFWTMKIERNRARDADVLAQLGENDWRTLVIWECAIRGAGRLSIEQVAERAHAWLDSAESGGEIRGLACPTRT